MMLIYKILAVLAIAGALLTGAYVKGRVNGVSATDVKWERVIAKDKAEWDERQRAAEEQANNQINALMNEKEADDALIDELRRQALADPASVGCGLSAASLLRIGRVR